jgi:hypothetical protein
MAQVHGIPGRYVADQARERRLTALIVGIVSLALMAVSAGFLFGRALPDSKISPQVGSTIASALLIGVLVLASWCVRRMNALDKERLHMMRGADGEFAVAQILARLPNEFHFINDITLPHGNIDHVVVGPTGVFVIDAKNWRGVITADGQGDLLLNGRPPGKPVVRQFTKSIMVLREQVIAMTPGLDTFFNGLLVFTSSRVEAKWGTTRNIKCLRDEQLYDHIVESKFGKRLSAGDVQRLAEAFDSIAHLDPDFSQPASVPRLAPIAHFQPAAALP